MHPGGTRRYIPNIRGRRDVSCDCTMHIASPHYFWPGGNFFLFIPPSQSHSTPLHPPTMKVALSAPTCAPTFPALPVTLRTCRKLKCRPPCRKSTLCR